MCTSVLGSVCLMSFHFYPNCCPDVSNNHSPPVVPLSVWFMQRHYEAAIPLVVVWKATCRCSVADVPLQNDSRAVAAPAAKFLLFLGGVTIPEPWLIWNLITSLTPPARANCRC